MNDENRPTEENMNPKPRRESSCDRIVIGKAGGSVERVVSEWASMYKRSSDDE